MTMTILKNTVLLLKSERSDGTSDKYEDLLRSNNFEVISVKTLTFQYKNLEILQEKLLDSDKYSGLILSSPRCVNAVHQAVPKEKIAEAWGYKRNFTVGQTTYDEALKYLDVECRGKESGNAKNLAQIIIQDSSTYSKPFLFPHGNLKTDTLKLELAKEQLQLQEVLVYDTLPNPAIEEDLSEATKGFTSLPEFVVFFSPSGFHTTITHLHKVASDLGQIKIIAIGPVTELAVQASHLPVYRTASSPTPEEVLRCLV